MISREKAAELLHDTADLIDGVKAREYGEPDPSFRAIAHYWQEYLGVNVTVMDVGMMMILLKVARNGRDRKKLDNFVDICGYAALIGSSCMDGGQGVAAGGEGCEEQRSTGGPDKDVGR